MQRVIRTSIYHAVSELQDRDTDRSEISQVGDRGITGEELVEPRSADANRDYSGIIAGVSPVRIGCFRGGK